MYSSFDRMYRLMSEEHNLLHLISQFGITMGVGDKTIDEVCTEHNIDTGTFLAVVNHTPNDKVDLATLQVYLRNAHTYFLDFQIPRIREELISAVSQVEMSQLKDARSQQIPILIIRFFDEYAAEIKHHIEHENSNDYALHPADDKAMHNRLDELKQLITKYFPIAANDTMIYAALQDIFELEAELALHCSIEDDILLPALKRQQPQDDEPLSDREKEVLVQLVNGLSNKEIANVLCISTHTVMSHRKNISKKLHIHSAAGLTIYAISNNLVCLDELKNI